MKPVSVSFKGTREGLRISFGEGAWRDLLSELAQQLDRPGAQSFFRGSRVQLETGERSIGVEELEELITLLSRHEMTLTTLLDDPQAQQRLEQRSAGGSAIVPSTSPRRTEPAALSTLPRAAAALGEVGLGSLTAPEQLASSTSSAAPSGDAPAGVSAAAAGEPRPPAGSNGKGVHEERLPQGSLATTEPEPEETSEPSPAGPPDLPPPESMAASAGGNGHQLEIDADLDAIASTTGPAVLLIRRTVRSGQIINFQGTVVVYGDVNAGSEIIAYGDVLVWGKLRGLVHAGAGGDDTAKVSALVLASTQLRIGKYIARAPDAKRPLNAPAEVARVRGGQIVVEPWAVHSSL